MLITAFDSGTYTGWAQALNGRIICCGLVRVFPDRPMKELPASGSGLVIVEKPVHRREGKTVDPNDLITLGIKVGRLVETYLVLGNQVRTIKPTDWKGSVPKAIQNTRDAAALDGPESVIVGRAMKTIPDSYQNNTWDAIGIALWAARREKER